MRSLCIAFQKEGTIGAPDDYPKQASSITLMGLTEIRFCNIYPIRLSAALVSFHELPEGNSTLDRYSFCNNFLIRLSTVI
jgi:hypothetical protein